MLNSDPFKIQSNQNGQLKQTSNTEALRIHFKKDNIQLLSVTARRDWRANPLFVDADFTPAPILTVSIDQRQTQWSQELRLSSNYQELDWTTGLYVSTVLSVWFLFGIAFWGLAQVVPVLQFMIR